MFKLAYACPWQMGESFRRTCSMRHRFQVEPSRFVSKLMKHGLQRLLNVCHICPCTWKDSEDACFVTSVPARDAVQILASFGNANYICVRLYMASEHNMCLEGFATWDTSEIPRALPSKAASLCLVFWWKEIRWALLFTLWSQGLHEVFVQ